jgi:hypothetical protein
MASDRLGSRPVDRRDRVHLRTAVLHIGGLLGWEPSDIIAFTEGLTGRPWRRCGCEEFETVLEEYLAVGRAKEAILAGIHQDLAESIDTIIEWAISQPATPQTRTETLRRLSALMSGSWGAFMQFAQRNEAAMPDLKAAAGFIERMDTLSNVLRPCDTIAGRIKARLALDALFMVNAREQQLGGTAVERTRVALDTAVDLVKE